MSDVRLIFITGATNAGKSTLIEGASKWRNVGVVSVGAMMRAKYHPSHFKGQANPAHTRAEALEMMMEGILQQIGAGLRTILVDGQPRDVDQLREIDSILWQRTDHVFECSFIHLFAPEIIRFTRALNRDRDDPHKLMLSYQRLRGDIPELYNVLTALLADRRDLIAVSSEDQRMIEPAIKFITDRSEPRA